MKMLDLLKLFCLTTYLGFAISIACGFFSSSLVYTEPQMYIVKSFGCLPLVLLILEITDQNSWTGKCLKWLRSKLPILNKPRRERKNIFLPSLHKRLNVLALSLGAVLSGAFLVVCTLDALPKWLMKAGYLEAAERTYLCLKPKGHVAIIGNCYRTDADYDKMWRPINRSRKEVDQSKVDTWFARQEKVTRVIEKVYGANSLEMIEWKHLLGGDADHFERYPLAAKMYEDSFHIAKQLHMEQAELNDFSWMTLYEALEVRRTDDYVFEKRAKEHLKEGISRCNNSAARVSVELAAMNFAGASEMIEDNDLWKQFNAMRADRTQSSVCEWPGMEVIRITEKYKI